MLTVKTPHEACPVDDTALVCSAKRGDAEAFGQLMERHAALIYRVAMHITGSREDSEDIVQEAFMKAFRHLQGFQERARFSTWVVRIAANEALGKLRGTRRLTVDASDSARGFFERRGYVAQQRNTVFLGDEWLANTTMEKQLEPKGSTP